MDEDIILKWTPSENATSYGVYVAKEPYGPRNLIYDLEGITGNSLNIGILPAGKYCFNMQAMNDAGASPFSNVTYFTVVKAPQEQKKTLNLKINDVYKRNSIVYVPIRYVAESLGSNVSWDNNTQSIVIQKGLDAIVFQIGSKKTYMQGIKNLDVATVIVNGKSYISIDSLSKIFGIEVKWNDKTNTLSIDYEELSNEKIIKDFLREGFYYFDYYNDFINENGNLGYGFRKVLSEIGEFGNKIKYGIFKSLTNLEIPFITEHPLKDYKKDVIKKNIEHILSNIPEIKEKYTPAGKELEVISDFIDVLKTSNDYAKSEFEAAIKKKYNISKIDLNTDAGRTYKYLDILGEGLSKVDKAFRWGSFTADSLEYYFNDYVRNMKYLQVIKDAAGEDDKDLLRAIEELSIEYSKGFAGFLYRNKTKIGQLTIKAIEKAMEDKLDGLELYGVATLILEKGMDISGNTKYAENVEQATGIMLINFRLITSFSRSLNRNVDFLTGKILPDVTEHSWNDLVSLFTVTKAGMIEAYKCMYEIAKDPVEKVYLKNQIDVIKSIQIRPTLPSQNQQAFFTK